MIPLWISIAGGTGAVARFITDGLIRTILGRRFPWGTLIINITGSFILGLITGAAMYDHGSVNLKLVVGTGFCGGFTTLSTASFEAVRLIEEKRYAGSLVQILGNCILAILGAFAGIALMR